MFTKVQIGAVSFNDNLNYNIDGFRGLEMPQVRFVNYNIAGEHFGMFVNALYSKRRFNLRGWVVGSSVNDLITKRDDLQKALDILSGEQPVKFTLPNGRATQIDAVMVSLDFAPREGWATAAQFQAEFEASFPFLVGQTENSQNITLQTGGGGKVPPDTMPMALSMDSGGRIVAINNGNAIYYPTARIAGPVTNPALRNSTTNKELRFLLTLLSGEYIEIDFRKKTVTDNLGTNRYSTKTGEWWFIQPGNNEIKFTADNYQTSALATFRYKDSYLGI